MKKNIFKYLVVILCTTSIISCKKNQNSEVVDSLKSTIDLNLGKRLIIPDSLELYNFLSDSIDIKEIFNSELKIYTHIDASCGTCIESLMAWNNLIPELNRNNIDVILICTSDNKFELLKYYFESKEIDNFSYPLFLDHKNNFLKNNKFMLKSKNFETVLTDKDDSILLLGNPNYSNKIKELYFKEIKKNQLK